MSRRPPDVALHVAGWIGVWGAGNPHWPGAAQTPRSYVSVAGLCGRIGPIALRGPRRLFCASEDPGPLPSKQVEIFTSTEAPRRMSPEIRYCPACLILSDEYESAGKELVTADFGTWWWKGRNGLGMQGPWRPTYRHERPEWRAELYEAMTSPEFKKMQKERAK